MSKASTHQAAPEAVWSNKNGGPIWCSRGHEILKISWSASCTGGSATWKDGKGERMSTSRLYSVTRPGRCWYKLGKIQKMVFGGNKFCQAWVGPKGICRGKCPRMQAKIRIFKASRNLTSDSCIQYAYRRVCILHASKPDSKCFQRKNAGEIQGHRTTGATFGTFHVDVKCLSISTIPMMVLPWSSDAIGPGGFESLKRPANTGEILAPVSVAVRDSNDCCWSRLLAAESQAD